MELLINGQTRNVQAATIVELLRDYGLEGKMVAVEIDGTIVPQEVWAETGLKPGMKIELVHFVGGG